MFSFLEKKTPDMLYHLSFWKRENDNEHQFMYQVFWPTEPTKNSRNICGEEHIYNNVATRDLTACHNSKI